MLTTLAHGDPLRKHAETVGATSVRKFDQVWNAYRYSARTAGKYQLAVMGGALRDAVVGSPFAVSVAVRAAWHQVTARMADNAYLAAMSTR